MSPVAPDARVLGARSRLFVALSTAYVAVVAVRAADPEHRLRASFAGVLALVVAASLGARDRWTALAAWGFAFALASLGAGESHGAAWSDSFGALGAAAASLAAAIAIARVVAPAGLARPRSRSPVVPVAVLAVAWSVAIAARFLHASEVRSGLAGHATWLAPAASVVAFVVLALHAWRTAVARRLELGVAARMDAAWGLVCASAGVACAAAFVDLASIEASLRAGVALGSLLVVATSLHGDPVALARASRRAIALVIVGGPLVVLGAVVVQSNPWQASAVVAIVGVLALGLGMAAPVLEEPLRPARGAWLDATQAAHEALLRTDPDEAVREALVALRAPAGLEAPSPELWTFDPLRVTTVDAAGYAHLAEGTLPASLLPTAVGEPEAILRFEVLEALQVRMSELRPLAHWMGDRGAMLAAVVTRAGEAEGLLLLPRGRRLEALSLEEARAIKRLADALAALCHARASLARSLDRERQAEVRAEGAELALSRAEAEIARRATTHALAAERLARPATIGIYSAAARFAFDAIEAAVHADKNLFVHAPAGIDAVPYVARAHLGGPRRGQALVVVEGTSTREHGLARWLDASTSPLALAERGALVLVDGAALPHDVQAAIARASSFSLVVTSATPFGEARSRLELALAARLADAAQASLPRLRERPEDLHAILSDRLAREGLRERGVPVGIDDAAFARLLDYPFDGEDAELASIAVKLVAACAREDAGVVRARHVDALFAIDTPSRRSIA